MLMSEIRFNILTVADVMSGTIRKPNVTLWAGFGNIYLPVKINKGFEIIDNESMHIMLKVKENLHVG